tara:strand:+ start:474 stop:1421 length:948 start_codon:yes stop_codon:yes gene_type:complete
MPDNQIESRVAIITGAGRGIGKAIARSLSAQGVCVIVADNGGNIGGYDENHKTAEEVANDLPGPAQAFTKNIASQEAAEELAAITISQYGSIDIVINCAAILRDGLVFKGKTDDWDKVITNNLSSAFYIIRATTPILRQQFKDKEGSSSPYNSGRIINIGSTAGLYGNFGQANYSSAKAGLFGLTRVTALEMARSNVTCNYVAPFARSRVTELIKPANKEQGEYKERALKVSPEHVANFVTYLCTPLASDITGQIFGVRGKEIFLFNQPRPIETIVNTDNTWTIDELAIAVDKNFKKKFTKLETDLEAFNTEPII